MSEFDVNSEVILSELGTVTTTISVDERQLIASFLDSGNKKIDVLIDPQISGDEFYRQTIAVVKAHNTLDSATRKIKPIVGKFFAFLRERPDLLPNFFITDKSGKYRPCSTFTDFIQMWVQQNLRMANSDAWDALRVAQEFPYLTPSEVEDIGIGKLKILSTAIPSNVKKDGRVSVPVQQEREKYIKAIKDHDLNYDGLKHLLANNGVMSEEQLTYVKIEIPGSLELKKKWADFKNDPDVQRYVGSTFDHVIFEAMMAESYPYMKSQGIVLENQ
jgi:hypothetical protein